MGLESLTTCRPISKVLEAYSWSLHKLRCEEVMVQQGGDEAGYEADRRWRDNTWFSDCVSLVQMSDASVTGPVYCEYILRWNSRFDHPGFCLGVCCLRGVTQCCPKNHERRKKRLATAPACPSPTVENHQSIPPLLLTTHQSPLTIISIAFNSKVLERSTRVN